MNQYKHIINLTGGALLGLTVTSGLILSSPLASADNSAVNNVRITIPSSCNLSSTSTTAHTATIDAGTYRTDIGESTITATCNDNEGFAIYAIGYTGEVHGNNTLKNIAQDSTATIASGTATNGATSNWAMKLTSVEGTYTPTIENGFGSYSTVPETNTKVVSYASNTDVGDGATGATIKSTYAAYIAPTQTAGTYEGKVKYTLVHPNNHPAPADSMLETGQIVNKKIKSLVSGTEVTATTTWDDSVKAVHMADVLPEGFEPTDANTISTTDSKHPVYIFFDNTDNAGILKFYTEGETIIMNPDSSDLFRRFRELNDISGLEEWDASHVTSMMLMFAQASSLSSLSALADWDISNVENLRLTFAVTGITSLAGLEDWDTSSVTTMSGLFYENTEITDISALTNWDVRNVQDMGQTFEGLISLTTLHGLENWNTSSLTKLSWTFRQNIALTDISALANWDTSNVYDMSRVFALNYALQDVAALANWNTSSVISMASMFDGDSALTTIDVSNWDTSKVETMSAMFEVGASHEGNGQLTEIIGLENWDTSNVTDMRWMFYGAGNMTHYDIANWDVSKVESFNHMFCDNFKLESLDLSRWNVSSVKTMYDMFDDARSLTTIGDVSHWNTSNLIDVGGWLNGASSFVGDNGTLDLSGWDTSNLKVTGEMFRATKLQTIDLSGWTFNSITNDSWEGAGSGIYGETGNTSNYKGLAGMFLNMPQLQTVYVSQTGLNSYDAAVARGVDTTNMWSGSNISGFTVKP